MHILGRLFHMLGPKCDKVQNPVSSSLPPQIFQTQYVLNQSNILQNYLLKRMVVVLVVITAWIMIWTCNLLVLTPDLVS